MCSESEVGIKPALSATVGHIASITIDKKNNLYVLASYPMCLLYIVRPAGVPWEAEENAVTLQRLKALFRRGILKLPFYDSEVSGTIPLKAMFFNPLNLLHVVPFPHT